jgi:hypothetical protein
VYIAQIEIGFYLRVVGPVETMCSMGICFFFQREIMYLEKTSDYCFQYACLNPEIYLH